MARSSSASVEEEKEGRVNARIRRTRRLHPKLKTRIVRAVPSVSLITLLFASRVSSFSTGGLAGARSGGCRRSAGAGSCRGGVVRARTAVSRVGTRMVATEGSLPSLSKVPSQQPPSSGVGAAGAAAAGTAAAAAIAAAGAGATEAAAAGAGEAETATTTGAGLITEPSATVEVGAGEQRSQRLRVATFFFFWYTFNVGYNLCTKFTLNALPLPMTLAAIQLLVGVPYVWTLWLTGLRKAPSLSAAKLRGVTPVAAAHTMAHVAAVVSIGAGAVGFVQVVKGAEPLFTSGLSFLAGSAMPWPVYLTLLPVIGGVAMASAGEISFSVLAFAAAMTSNASAASRSVLGKMYMAKDEKSGAPMDAGNLYAVMTMLGCLVLTPLALTIEGPKAASVWSAAVNAGHAPRSLVKNAFLSGLFFYLYNEVSFYALSIIHPVTHALGNTLKRVVMIIVSVVVLNHKFTPLGLAGCITAIGGVMAYSMTKAKLESSAALKGVKEKAQAVAASAAASAAA